MKKYEYKSLQKVDVELMELGKEGWKLCAIDTYDPFSPSWIFERETSDRDVHIGLLVSCAYMRNVSNLQHRTIGEFNSFVESVMKGELPGYEFEWNDKNAIEIWIEKFYEYCNKEYKEIESRMHEKNGEENEY